jgi:hypothetical protein
LNGALTRIDQHLKEFATWHTEFENSKKSVGEAMLSGAFQELVVNGIAPDGTVHRPNAGIVYALREAAAELAVGGWAAISEAGRWIIVRYPEQRPERYGCKSWRQAVHQSKVFELRYLEINGRRTACYRLRE